jgi:hypothetical protein
MPAGLSVRDDAFRIHMTASCRDCDGIPKVADAGKVIADHGEMVQIMHNGVKVVAGGYYGDWMTAIIRELRGHHEPQEELAFDALLRFVPDDGTMLELGGHWSYYSLWFLAKKPKGAATLNSTTPASNSLPALLGGAAKRQFSSIPSQLAEFSST